MLGAIHVDERSTERVLVAALRDSARNEQGINEATHELKSSFTRVYSAVECSWNSYVFEIIGVNDSNATFR